MKKRDWIIIFTLFIIGILISSLVSVAATGNLFDSNEVSYDNTSSGMNSTNVKSAVDELYAAASDYSNINSRVQALEDNAGDIFRILGKEDSGDVGLRIFDKNSKLRTILVYGQGSGISSLASLDSTGTWNNFGQLNIYGNPVNLNAGSGLNITSNSVKVNNKEVLTSNVQSCTFTKNSTNVTNVSQTNCVKYNDICIVNIMMEVNAFTQWKDYALGTLNVKSKAKTFSTYTPQGSSGNYASDMYIDVNGSTIYADPRAHTFNSIEWIRGQIVFPCEYI